MLVQGGDSVFYGELNAFCENVTFHQVTNLIKSGQSADVSFTNSLVVMVNANGATVSGVNNQFLSSDTGLFQTVGAGAHYLATNCPAGIRNAGTTSINPTLLAELRQKTTRAPRWYTDAWIDGSWPGTWVPVVGRDTNSTTVDLGYHYDPLDYYFDGYTILFSGTLTLTNGVQVGFGGPFYIEPGAVLVSQGKPNQLNRVVQCRTVQEQAVGWASDPTLSSDSVYNSITVNCRFTEFSRLAGPGGHVSDDYKGGTWNFRDCQFRGAQMSFAGQSCALNVGLTNCLFERSGFNAGGSNLTLKAYNNLFYQGGVWLSSSNTANAFTFRDNFFYGNNLTNNLVIWGTLVYDHNGYVTNCDRLGIGTGDVIVATDFTFQSSWLGNYYQPTNSPLIDAGSRNATNAGLFHYTTQTNQVKEGITPVDIGYHYVAVDATGKPVDSNGDGIPDYLADKNGNGVKDPGESPWGIIAIDDNAQTFELQPVTIPVLANDSDQNGGTLTIASVTQGTHGSVTINPDKTVTYTPGLDPTTLNLIPSPAGQQFSVSSVNVHGLACGALVVANGNTHAALWQIGGGITDLDPTGTYSVAETINDNGTVVGFMNVAGGVSHAFKYSQGQMTDLHSQVAGADFPNSIAWGVNNQGQICGQTYSTATGLNQAFFMDNNNSVTHLDSFGGLFIAAYGINDSGLVVGQSDTTDLLQAFKWQPGDAAPTDLASYFTIPNQVATSVNAQGDIAGYTWLYYNQWAFVIQNGVFKDLSDGYQNSYVWALNSKDQLVGAWDGQATGYHDRALYWQGSQHYDLNTLLPSGSGWVLNDAVSINENGLIVGNGTYQGQPRAFATVAPVPYAGPDTFTYTISDGNATASATVNVNVVNPVHAVDDKATVFEETAKVIDVLGNDSDQSGGNLMVSSVTQGAHGSVTINSDNTVTYTPGPSPATVNLISPPVGQQFSVSSVNVHGLACGALVVANGNTHAALWQIGGGITDLDPTGTYSVAETINDNGTVVGFMNVAGGVSHAFKYSQGQMTDLHSQVAGADFPNSIAWGVNDQGQICGQTYSTATGLNQAFFMDNNNSVTHLDSFGGLFIAAYGINDSGLVVGQSDTTDLLQAFKWQPGDAAPTDLASYFTIPNQVATSVNAQGDIAGYTWLYYNQWAFVIQNGVFKDLSDGYQNSYVWALNSKDQLVGAWDGQATGYHDRALYWQGSQHYDLNTLLPSGSGWVLNDAVSINENGLIVGNGTYQGQPRAFATVAPTIYEGPDTFTYTASDGIGSASATVSVNVVDPDLDTDGNGLPDWWEMQYFNHLGVDPNADADGDGVSNYVEYLEGRNPNSPGTVPDSSGNFISLIVF